MKNKSYLLLILVASLPLTGLLGCGQKLSGKQTWEYKTIVRARTFPIGNSVNASVPANDWSLWFEDGKQFPTPDDPLAKINQLGDQGWELISITPRSSLAADWIAGSTTDETWVFKRPKS